VAAALTEDALGGQARRIHDLSVACGVALGLRPIDHQPRQAVVGLRVEPKLHIVADETSDRVENDTGLPGDRDGF